ncbi:hypothetical protein GCM10020254_14110 [Streptomyces goshikiensis]
MVARAPAHLAEVEAYERGAVQQQSEAERGQRRPGEPRLPVRRGEHRREEGEPLGRDADEEGRPGHPPVPVPVRHDGVRQPRPERGGQCQRGGGRRLPSQHREAGPEDGGGGDRRQRGRGVGLGAEAAAVAGQPGGEIPGEDEPEQRRDGEGREGQRFVPDQVQADGEDPGGHDGRARRRGQSGQPGALACGVHPSSGHPWRATRQRGAPASAGPRPGGFSGRRGCGTGR